MKKTHLHIPTESNPLEIDSIKFYPNRFTISGETILYENIFSLEYEPSSSTVNFATSYSMTFAIYHNSNGKKNRTSIIGVYEKGKLKGNPSKKVYEKLNLAYNFISKITINQRVKRYISEILTKGYFSYCDKYAQLNKVELFEPTYRFYENGTLTEKNKEIANIITQYKNNELQWMLSYQGYKSSSFDPFCFTVANHNAKWYQFLSKTKNIYTIFDNDIFNALLVNFLRKGYFIHPNKVISELEKSELENKFINFLNSKQFG